MHNLPATPETLDEGLVSLARSGDRAAFDKLATRYRHVLLALAFLRTRNLAEAEDLVQEILVRAWRSLGGLRTSAQFLPWLKTLTANTCSTWYRRRSFRTASLDTEPAFQVLVDARPRPSDSLFNGERQRELHRALLELPQANRVALLMHVWGDYSYAEIAAFTEVRVTTVEGRIYRARRQMRDLLRDEGTAFFSGYPARTAEEGSKENRREGNNDS